MNPPARRLRFVAVAVVAVVLGNGSAPAARAGWTTTVSAAVRHDDNTSNSIRIQKPDTAVAADLTLSTLRVINRDWQGNLAFRADASHWRRWDGLDLTTAGATLGLRRKFGLGPYAPRLDLTLTPVVSHAATAPRSARALTTRLAYARRLSPGLAWQAAAEVARVDARRAVYSTTGHTFSLGATWDATPDWRLSATVRHRDGDLVSWCRNSWPEFAGTTQWLDGIFAGDWFPYRTHSRTRGLNLSLAYAIGDHTSAAFTADISRSAAVHQSHVYTNEIFSLQVVHVF